MINIGITGGETVAAGELVRLLINHPDVAIKWIFSNHEHGAISNFHKGLLGECDLKIQDSIDDDVDIIFCCDLESEELCENALLNNTHLRVVDLTRSISNNDTYMYGLCEINRKFMVHNCYGVVRMPSPQAMLTLLSVIPLAVDHKIESDINVDIQCGQLTEVIEDAKLKDELTDVLLALQPGFNGNINVSTRSDGTTMRGIATTVTLACNKDIDSIKERYIDYYDDHNFTYVSDRNVGIADVANTNKCLLQLSSDGDTLTVKAVGDSLLKGCAGNAVHVMNLLFGLHERVGLGLKAQVF